MSKFELNADFIERFRGVKPPFGFNGLGELIYLRTYSRIKSNGENETWIDTITRVVNGCYNLQKKWIDEQGLGWNSLVAQKSAQEMFTRIFNMKFLPPGRSLYALGTDITEKRSLYASLNNLIPSPFILSSF